MNGNRLNILITGASGFIGSHLVERALRDGYITWAATRTESNMKNLTDGSIHFIELNYCNPKALYNQLQAHSRRASKWDVIIHCAGATKCQSKADFDRINYKATCIFVEALIKLDMTPRQFIFMSSLGSYGPIHEQLPHIPITESDIPCPNTAYGQSKLKAEQYLMNLREFPYVIFRPTGVYGPRDKDYTLLIDYVMRHHISISLGRSPQSATFVYIADLVEAVFLAIEKKIVRRSYFVTDGCTYKSQDFTAMTCQLLGHKHMYHIRIPLWIAHITAIAADTVGHLLGHPFTFNSDKYHILKQRNWTCDITPLAKDLGYTPKYNLRRGLAETLLERLHHAHHTQEVTPP